MKSFSSILILGLTACILAEEPPELMLDNPPIRLKKKGEKPKPEVPPKLDGEPKPEEPPKLDDEPKPEIPPKLEDPENLDEMKGRLPPEESKEDILNRIAKNTRRAEDRLANQELGEGTKQVQRDIINDLDKLIQQMQQQQKQNQGGGGGGQGQRASSGSKKPQGSQGRQQQNNNKLSRKPQQGNKPDQSTRNKPKKQNQTATIPHGGNGGQQGNDPNNPNKEFDLWGHLPQKERMLMNRYMREKFMQKYEEETKRYYRRLAEKSRQN